MSRAEAVWLIFAPAIGIWAAIAAYRASKRTQESGSWPSTDGVIVKSMLAKYRGMAKAIVAYYYYTPEERFGSSFGPGGSLVANPAAVVRRYPVGAKVRVRYNPKRPEVSFLDSGLTVQSRSLKFLAVVGISFPFLYFLWTRWWQ